MYVIPCRDCNRYYIIQTGQLRRRCTDHLRNVTGTGAPVAYVQATGHVMNIDNIKIVYPTKIYRRRQIVESALTCFVFFLLFGFLTLGYSL